MISDEYLKKHNIKNVQILSEMPMTSNPNAIKIDPALYIHFNNGDETTLKLPNDYNINKIEDIIDSLIREYEIDIRGKKLKQITNGIH